MSDFPLTRRSFIRDCSAGALAVTAAYGCNREESVSPSPAAPLSRPEDVLESIRPDPATGLAEAVIVKGPTNPLVFTDQVRPRNPAEPMHRQLKDVMDQLSENLAAAGSGWGALVRMHFYVRSDKVADEIRKVLAKAFQEVHKPAATFMRGELEFPEVAFVLDVVSLCGRPEPADAAAVRRTPRAAVVPHGPLLFISGETGSGQIEAATREALAKLEKLLRHSGCDWSHVAQLKSFVNPITAAGTVRSTIQAFFADRPVPMLVFVEWGSTNPPIEIELVAAVPKARGDAMPGPIEYLTLPDDTKSAIYSKAAIVKTERLLFTSGFYGDGPDTGARIRDIFGKLRTLTEQSGGNLEHLVKATYYVDAESSKLLNDIRPEFYNPDRPPAASKAIVRGVGRSDRKITIDMIAAAK